MRLLSKVLPIVASAIVAARVHAAVPDTFLYVGNLREDGVPADGNFSVTFQIFDDENAGTKLYEETVASLIVIDGAMIHELGESPSNPLSDAELAGGELFLQVTVNGTQLEPRVPLRSVPFAIEARRASEATGTLETRLGAVEAGARSASYVVDIGSGCTVVRQFGAGSGVSCSRTASGELSLNFGATFTAAPICSGAPLESGVFVLPRNPQTATAGVFRIFSFSAGNPIPIDGIAHITCIGD